MKLSGFLKGVIYASLVLIPMLAWFVSPSTFFPYITGKNFAFRFLIEISMVAWVALAILEPAYRPKKSLVFYSYSFFLLVICIANIFGADPYLSFFSNFERSEGWFTHLYLFVYFTILYSVYKIDKDWLKMLGWFAVANIAISLEAVIQLLGQKDFYLSKLYGSNVTSLINSVYPTSMGNGLRLDSTLGNAAYFGIFTLFFYFINILLASKVNRWKGSQGWRAVSMVVGSALLVLLSKFFAVVASDSSSLSLGGLSSFVWFVGIIGLIFGGYNFAKKNSEGEIGSWPFAIFGALSGFLLFYTQTRGSYIGLLLGTIVAIYCFVSSGILRRIKNKVTKNITGVFMGLAVFILIPSLLVVGLGLLKGSNLATNSVVLSRLATINVPSFEKAASSIQNDNYLEMLNVFGEATIVSRVLNGVMSVDGWSESTKTKLIGYGQENYTTVFAQHFDPRMYAQEAWFDRAHNVFFDWLVAGGIVGLLAYLALYLTPMYMLWYGKGKGNINIVEKSILTGALVGYFVHNIFVFDSLTSLIMFVLVLAYISSRTRDTESHIKDESKLTKHVRPAVIYTYLSIASVATILLFTFTVFKPLSANLDTISAMRSINSINSYTEVPAALSSVLNYFKSAIGSNSYGTEEVTEQMISKVIDLSSLDFSKVEESKRDKAIKDYQDLKDLTESQMMKNLAEHPSAKGFSLYSSYLRYSGRLTEAKEYGAKAVSMAPNKQTLVGDYIDTLMDLKEYSAAYDLAKKMFESEKTYLYSEQKYITTAAYAGKKAEAKLQLEDLRKRNPDAAKELDAKLVTLLK